MDHFLDYLAGSFLQGAEKSISLVQGGRSRQAAALAWEKGSSGPQAEVYSEWLESVKENPAVIDFEVRLIILKVREVQQFTPVRGACHIILFSFPFQMINKYVMEKYLFLNR